MRSSFLDNNPFSWKLLIYVIILRVALQWISHDLWINWHSSPTTKNNSGLVTVRQTSFPTILLYYLTLSYTLLSSLQKFTSATIGVPIGLHPRSIDPMHNFSKKEAICFFKWNFNIKKYMYFLCFCHKMLLKIAYCLSQDSFITFQLMEYHPQIARRTIPEVVRRTNREWS